LNAALPKRQHYRLTLAILFFSALAFAFAQTMVVPALPEMQRQYNTSATTVTFVLTAFLLTSAVATPILGRLGDMFGKERLLVIVLTVFGIGSVVSANASSIEVVIAGRAIQGVAGAVFPLSFGIIRDEFPREKVSTAIGTISATFGVGGGIGIVASGLIIDNIGLEWIFWVSAAVIAVATVSTHFFVPESPVKSPARIDWAGGLMMTTSLGAMLIAVSEGNTWGWGSPGVIGLLALSVVVAIFWVRFESRVPEPMVDIRVMRRRAVWTTNLVAFLVGFGMFGSFMLIPQLVQLTTSSGVGFGASATQSGLYMLPSSIFMLMAGPLAGWLGSRFGSRLPLRIGTVRSASASASHSHRWRT